MPSQHVDLVNRLFLLNTLFIDAIFMFLEGILTSGETGCEMFYSTTVLKMRCSYSQRGAFTDFR